MSTEAGEVHIDSIGFPDEDASASFLVSPEDMRIDRREQ